MRFTYAARIKKSCIDWAVINACVEYGEYEDIKKKERRRKKADKKAPRNLHKVTVFRGNRRVCHKKSAA